MQVKQESPETRENRALVIEQLVTDMNNGRGDYSYDVVETIHYSDRMVEGVRVVTQERDFIVTRRERGATVDIATLRFDADGMLRTALIERGTEFHLVPRVLRAVGA
jgi:hypothetical protein